MAKAEKIVVLTGAGMSAESGIRTFRDNGGLWEEHDVMEVATPEVWARDPELVLRFYNERRAQMNTVHPNAGHLTLAELEAKFEVTIITQNVDNLHERAGSSRVMHLHGELGKVRSTFNPNSIYNWDNDLKLGDRCEEGYQLRPHIVWFGEAVPMMEKAMKEMITAERIIIIGTSMVVYPAAGLVGFAPRFVPVHYIDPAPAVNNFELNLRKKLEIISKPATQGVRDLVDRLLEDAH